MIKILIGGSPCTFWSIAQKNNRETTAEGQGWELFKNYLIAKEKFQPDIFLYENNKSAAKPIKDQIKQELHVTEGGNLFEEDTGVRYIEINSALVSAQNRQRFYVHNCGEVQQPDDRGILLKDILETDVFDVDPVGETTDGKAFCLTANYDGAYPEHTLHRHVRTMVAEPVSIGFSNRREEDGKLYRRFETSGEPKANALTTVRTDSMVAEPIQVGSLPRPNGELSTSQAFRIYAQDGKSVTLSANGGGCGGKTGLYAIPAMPVQEATAKGYTMVTWGGCIDLQHPHSKTRRGRLMVEKSNCLQTSNEFYQYMGTTPVYEVKDSMITIKGKQYPIKLVDGYYIIRKLSVTECCRLQTMPDHYCDAVSDTQAYKGLGNGWTAEVIKHILNGALKDVPKDEEIVVLSMYDGIGTGRYILDSMGFTNVKYYAYEIDKYAIQIATSNYPDIIECGDAFQVREDDWRLPIED